MARFIFQELLDFMVKHDASDLYVNIGEVPSVRINGKLHKLQASPIEPSDMELIFDQVLSPQKKKEFEEQMELNVTMVNEQHQRFRANFYRQQQLPGAVIRRIKTQIPKPEELGLPPSYTTAVMEKTGLVLVVGPTGSGKSSSLASMLHHRNQHGSGHVIIIEDPIEYVHQNQNCIFIQREVGMDTGSYKTALKNALRQSPDVVVIGEIRDRDTMENALHFSETGHLCLATLHANNTTQALEHIINFFPEEMHRQVYGSLAANVKMIFSQKLVENKQGKRTLVAEIMKNYALIKRYIEEGRMKEIHDIVEKSGDQGMQTFDQALLKFVVSGEISQEVAMREADNAGNLKLRLNQAIISAGLDRVNVSQSAKLPTYSNLDDAEFDTSMN